MTEYCNCEQCTKLAERFTHLAYERLGLLRRTGDYGNKHFQVTLGMVHALIGHMEGKPRGTDAPEPNEPTYGEY